MITINDLKTAGIAEENQQQIIELLGDKAEHFTTVSAVRKMSDDHDLAVLTLTKIPKNPNEKTSEYIKRAPQEFADKMYSERFEKESKELSGKIKELEEQLSAKPGDEKLLKKLKELEEKEASIPKLIDESVKKHKEENEKLKSEIALSKKEWELRSRIPQIRKDADTEFVDFKIKSAIEKAITEYDVHELKDDKSIELRKSNDYVNHIGLTEFYDKELGSILEKAHQQPGGGSGAGEKHRQNGKIVFDAADDDAAKVIKIKTHLATVELIDPLDNKYEKRFNEELINAGMKHLTTIPETK